MSNLIRKSKKGFTLIELMIVVAIIGILAAIAIPNFLRFQLKSKSSEGKVNIAAIRTAEESYLAEFGEYVGVATPVPALIPGTSKAAVPRRRATSTRWAGRPRARCSSTTRSRTPRPRRAPTRSRRRRTSTATP
jgi:prepilin-type N-terminal cleavage/methylation domain-containing protein